MKTLNDLHFRLLWRIAAVVLVGLIAGCGRSDGNRGIRDSASDSVNDNARNGEVFIVMASGASQKLGLVEVFAIPEAAVTEAQMAAIAEQLGQLDTAQKNILSAKLAREKAGKRIKERGYQGEAIDEYNGMVKAEKAAHSERDEKSQGLLDLWQRVVATPHSSAKTDSNGVFSIPCRKGDWICAHTTRTIDEVTDHLIWIVRADKLPLAGKILLSNDNLVTPPGT